MLIASFASTALSFPYGMAFDRAGNMYVANSGNNTIHEFGPTGKDLGTFASTGLIEPFGLVFDSSGNLFVANGYPLASLSTNSVLPVPI